MSKQPSDAAMKAALDILYNGYSDVSIARILDAFAEAAVRDEIESIRGWLGVYVSDSVVRQFDEDNKRGAELADDIRAMRPEDKT